MEIPGGWGGELKQKCPPWGGMEYFLELHFANKCKFFPVFQKKAAIVFKRKQNNH